MRARSRAPAIGPAEAAHALSFFGPPPEQGCGLPRSPACAPRCASCSRDGRERGRDRTGRVPPLAGTAGHRRGEWGQPGIRNAGLRSFGGICRRAAQRCRLRGSLRGVRLSVHGGALSSRPRHHRTRANRIPEGSPPHPGEFRGGRRCCAVAGCRPRLECGLARHLDQRLRSGGFHRVRARKHRPRKARYLPLSDQSGPCRGGGSRRRRHHEPGHGRGDRHLRGPSQHALFDPGARRHDRGRPYARCGRPDVRGRCRSPRRVPRDRALARHGT